MTFDRQDGIAVHVGAADRGLENARIFPGPHCRQARAAGPEDLSPPSAGSGLAGAVLACTAPLAFCSGLIGLALSPRFEAPVPRWFILAYGLGCVLLTLLAPVLKREKGGSR